MVKEERELRDGIRSVGDRGPWNRSMQRKVTALIKAAREDEYAKACGITSQADAKRIAKKYYIARAAAIQGCKTAKPWTRCSGKEDMPCH